MSGAEFLQARAGPPLAPDGIGNAATLAPLILDFK